MGGLNMKVRGICKECGLEFFIETENYGTDESLCEHCITEKENAESRQNEGGA